MTQIANMILNELSVSDDIRKKIDFIKNSKLDYSTFEKFKFFLLDLESFEPNPKLTQKMSKNQVNKKIAYILEELDNFIQNINKKSQENSNLEQKLDSKENLNEKENLNKESKERFTKLLLRLNEICANEEPTISYEECQVLLKEMNELLTKNLGESENEFLKNMKAEFTRYETIFKEKENLKDLPDLPLSYYENGQKISEEEKKLGLQEQQKPSISLFDNEELKPSYDPNKVQSYDEIMDKKIKKRGKAY